MTHIGHPANVGRFAVCYLSYRDRSQDKRKYHAFGAACLMKIGLLALLAFLLLLGNPGVAEVSSSSEGGVLQQTIAKDIRDEIADRDLGAVRAVIEGHFFEPLPETVEVQSALDINGGRYLHVGFDHPGNRFGESAKYVIGLGSKSEGKPWTLNQIMIHSQHAVPGYDDPISVIGALEPDTVAELVEHVSRFWTTSEAGPMKIAGVSSNALPPLRLQPESLQGQVPEVVYSVHVSSLEPAKPYIPPGSESAGLAIALMSSNSVFSIWLKRDDRGQLVTTDVYPSGFPVTDPDRLELLRSHVEQPSGPADAQQRMDAALAVVPETARSTEMQGMSMMLDGQTKIFLAHYPEVQVSDRRQATSMISCGRVAGTDTPWQCSYRVMSATQRVAGQQIPIMLSVDADEALIDEIAHALRTALADHPSVEGSEGDIEISIISRDVEKWRAFFRRGLNSYSVVFRYDGALEIIAVESKG